MNSASFLVSDDNFPPMGRSVSRGPVAAVGATGGSSPPGDLDQDIYVDVNMPQGNISSRPVSQGSALTPHSQHSRPGNKITNREMMFSQQRKSAHARALYLRFFY